MKINQRSNLTASRSLTPTFLALALLGLTLTACSTLPSFSSLNSVYGYAPDAVYRPAPQAAPPITGPRKTGTPYKIMGKWYTPLKNSAGYREKGIASWYGDEFHGRKTANGERYSMYAYTAAHPTLPLPTWVKVTNLTNGRSILVRVNDRGPFVRGRLIDLSYNSARALGYAEQGTAPVLVEAMPTDGSPLRTPPATTPDILLAESNTHNPSVAALTTSSFTQRVTQKEEIYQEKPTLQATVNVPIYVQTGAFGQAANAQRQRKALEKIYNDVRIMEATVKNKHFYRVQVGPLESVDIADQVLARLIHEGYKDAIIHVE